MIWRLILAAFLTLCLCTIGQAPRAQFNGCSAGFCTPAAVSGAAYTGPGDVVSGAFGWWGLRCYNSAYAGNVADIWDSATGNTTETLLTCSSGGTLNQTVNTLATTCAVACSVKTLYDQSGANKCTGAAACDVTQATLAQRPAFTRTGCAGLSGMQTWCMTFNGTNSNLQSSLTWAGGSVAQAYTGICAANFTAHPANGACISVGNAVADGFIIFVTATPTIGIYSGTNSTTSTGGAINTWYSMQATFSGASSATYINGSSTTSLSAGTQAIANGDKAYFGDDPFSDFPTSLQVEGGLWSGSFSGGNQSSMNSNIRAFWGF